MRTLVIVCVVLASVYTYSEACTCFPQHPQVQFCNADFVIKAKILKRKETGPSQTDDVVYTVKIIQNYKRGRYHIGRRVQKIFTASNSAACGSFFEIGREYIITGSIRENKWRTNLCSWNLQTSSLTQYQRNALKFGFYKKSCSCNKYVSVGSVLNLHETSVSLTRAPISHVSSEKTPVDGLDMAVAGVLLLVFNIEYGLLKQVGLKNM